MNSVVRLNKTIYQNVHNFVETYNVFAHATSFLCKGNTIKNKLN